MWKCRALWDYALNYTPTLSHAALLWSLLHSNNVPTALQSQHPWQPLGGTPPSMPQHTCTLLYHFSLTPFLVPLFFSGLLLQLHTEPLLVSLPTPDFSMPYNVICFVSTVVAIAFGTLFNLTTKTLQPVEQDEARGGLTLLQRLFRLFRRTWHAYNIAC